MKITIEAETTQESEAMKEPFVRAGVSHLCIVGRCGADPTRFMTGNLLEIIGGLTQAIEEVRSELNKKTCTAGVIDAHNMMVKARQDAALLAAANDDVANGRPLRLHRP